MRIPHIALLGLFWLAACNRPPEPAVPSLPVTPAPPVSVVASQAVDATVPAVPDTQISLLATAATLKAEGKLVAARDLLRPVAEAPEPPAKLLALLGEINTQILFTPVAAPEKVDHTIAPGDTLGKLAKQFGTTVDYIKRSNNLTRDMIRAGDRLRIYRGQFAVQVSKTANTLTLTDGGKFLKRYRVGTGQFSKTPVGSFRVTTRIENPDWYRADGDVVRFGHPDNILGTHWLGIDVAGFGIHGTWATNSIGTQSSAGCVRLLNHDVAELYVLLPLGTPVSIQD
jgi:lipoprotein-anchoring transpeptidase ErfK/SrfK